LHTTLGEWLVAAAVQFINNESVAVCPGVRSQENSEQRSDDDDEQNRHANHNHDFFLIKNNHNHDVFFSFTKKRAKKRG